MTEELKACPFCGHEAEIELGKTGDGKDWYYVGCPHCTGSSEQQDWNSRPVEDSLLETINGLHQEIKEIQHGFDIQQAAAVKFEEENKKLREALEDIISSIDGLNNIFDTGKALTKISIVAREALK